MSVILKAGKEKIFKQQHLWIFSGAIESFPQHFHQGEIYPVYSSSSELLGHGYFHQGLSLCGRIISFGEEHPWDAVCRQLDQSIAFRDSLFDPQKTNAFRLVNGEGDRLPGLVIDQYGDALVLQSGSLGMDLLKPRIVEYLISKKRWKNIYEKSTGSSRKEEKLKEEVGVLHGTMQDQLQVIENGLLFNVHWRQGQKTGFFLDQREMRKQVEALSDQRLVLNCFSYSGGFSLYALRGNATRVDSVDVSEKAIAWTKEHVALNGFSEEKHQGIAQDAFEFLKKNQLQYDLVILDPPAFAKKKHDTLKAIKGYRDLNALVMSKMPAGSLLLTCSCSYYVDATLFKTMLFQAAKASGKNVQIVGEHHLAMDHPVNLFHPESSYLKSVLLYLT